MSEQEDIKKEEVTGEEKPEPAEGEAAAADETKPDKPSEGEKPAEAAESPQEAAAEEEEPEEEEPDDGVPIALVTGASGFIAMHLIKQLLEQGRYRVRGTVRNKKREDKVFIVLDVDRSLCMTGKWDGLVEFLVAQSEFCG